MQGSALRPGKGLNALCKPQVSKGCNPLVGYTERGSRITFGIQGKALSYVFLRAGVEI